MADDPLMKPGVQAKKSEARLLSVHEPISKRFLSVGQIQHTIGVGWNCTATLVAGVEAPPRDKPALILTAGHCAAGTTGDNEVVIDRPMGEGWFFVPSYFHDNQDEHRKVPIVKILYSSMKRTDIGILQLGETYGELLDRGLKPVLLAPATTAPMEIEMAHIPVGLFPDRFMRYSACITRDSATVFELANEYPEERLDHPWLWPRAIPNDCVGVYGGSSGSPVFIKDKSEISAVISTATDARPRDCGYVGIPCEVEDGQATVKESTVYLAATDTLIGTLKADGTFDPSTLDPGNSINLQRQARWDSPPGQWNLIADDAYESIRFKTGQADKTHCEDPAGYGVATPVINQPLLSLPTPPEPGIYTVCAIGKRPGSEQWQPYSQATAKLRKIE